MTADGLASLERLFRIAVDTFNSGVSMRVVAVSAKTFRELVEHMGPRCFYVEVLGHDALRLPNFPGGGDLLVIPR